MPEGILTRSSFILKALPGGRGGRRGGGSEWATRKGYLSSHRTNCYSNTSLGLTRGRTDLGDYTEAKKKQQQQHEQDKS